MKVAVPDLRPRYCPTMARPDSALEDGLQRAVWPWGLDDLRMVGGDCVLHPGTPQLVLPTLDQTEDGRVDLQPRGGLFPFPPPESDADPVQLAGMAMTQGASQADSSPG